MSAFNPLDPATWPVNLTAHEVAAIYRRRSVSGLRKACQRNQFVPAPYKVKPYLWRRVDVIRDVEGARGGSALRRVS